MTGQNGQFRIELVLPVRVETGGGVGHDGWVRPALTSLFKQEFGAREVKVRRPDEEKGGRYGDGEEEREDLALVPEDDVIELTQRRGPVALSRQGLGQVRRLLFVAYHSHGEGC